MATRFIIEVTLKKGDIVGFYGAGKCITNDYNALTYRSEEIAAAEQEIRDAWKDRLVSMRVVDDPYEGLRKIASYAAMAIC